MSSVLNALFAPAIVTFGLVCIARGRVAPRRERLSWLLIGAALTFNALGANGADVVEKGAASFTWPMLVIGWLLYYPLVWTGLWRLASADYRPRTRAAALDGLAAALVVGAVCGAFVVEPLREQAQASSLHAFSAISFPLGDGLLLALVAGIVAAKGWRAPMRWLLLIAAQCTCLATDILWAIPHLTGSSQVIACQLLWIVSSATFAAAALAPATRAPARSTASPLSAGELLTPLAIAAVALGLIAVDHHRGIGSLGFGASVAAILVVVARGTLAFRDYELLLQRTIHDANVDVLTGLGNRRALGRDLATGFAAGTNARLMLLDLDGFKVYNDTHGHLAGDELLKRLGDRLADAVVGSGRAYRLGGDEFCILLQRGSGTAAVRAALLGGSITAAVGVVDIPREARTERAALALADERMYESKAPRRTAMPEPVLV